MLAQTIAIVLPLLLLFALPGAAGVVSKREFDQLRADYPQPTVPPTGWRKYFYWLLYAPLGARISAPALALIIALICGGLAALIQGASVVSALDQILAAFIAPFVATYLHGFAHLSTQLPASSGDDAAPEAPVHE